MVDGGRWAARRIEESVEIRKWVEGKEERK